MTKASRGQRNQIGTVIEVDPVTGEQWMPVPVDNLWKDFAVSNEGRIRNRINGKYPKLWENQSGSYAVSLRSKVGDRFQTVARQVNHLVATSFVPNPTNHKYIRHLDGNPRNNAASNLEWHSTPREKHYPSVRLKSVTVLDADDDFAKLLIELFPDTTPRNPEDFIDLPGKFSRFIETLYPDDSTTDADSDPALTTEPPKENPNIDPTP